MSRWGFCPDCSLWRYADWDARTATPSCPVCAAAPSPIETIGDDGVGRLVLVLELPPGADLPLLG